MLVACPLKFLCQSPSVLVLVQERLGLAPLFWPNEPKEEVDEEASVVVPFTAPGSA
jgi:hypothetical protein